MSDFETKLHALVSAQLAGGAEDGALLVERLTNALGLAIAMGSGGNQAKADTFLTGVEGYLAETVAHHMRLAKLIGTFQGPRP